MATNRCMVDIETIGLDIGSVIASIGAVEFTPSGRLGDEFSRSIRLESCQEAGLEIDAVTLEWWLDQDDAAQEQLTGGEDLTRVLTGFTCWYQDHDFDEIWANSPSFDCEMLEHAYEQVGIQAPWDFYDERDFRTLTELGIEPRTKHQGTEHDALDDARYQAGCASDILSQLEVDDGQK